MTKCLLNKFTKCKSVKPNKLFFYLQYICWLFCPKGVHTFALYNTSHPVGHRNTTDCVIYSIVSYSVAQKHSAAFTSRRRVKLINVQLLEYPECIVQLCKYIV